MSVRGTHLDKWSCLALKVFIVKLLVYSRGWSHRFIGRDNTALTEVFAEIWECDYTDKNRSEGARKMSSQTVRLILKGKWRWTATLLPKLPAGSVHHSF